MTYIIKPQRQFHFSPLRYPGGKSSLYSLLCDVIEKGGNKESCYIEPYAGGAGAGLALLMMEKVSRIVINDYDEAVYYFWHSMLNETERFINKIRKIELSVAEWERQRRIYENTNSSFSLGFSAFYLNRTNYSGVITGGPIGGFQQKGKWKIDARFNKDTLIDRIERISYYKNRITLKNMDGIDLINKYSKRNDVFVYLDPPYYVKGGSLYLNSLLHDDHLRLSKALKSKKSMRWLLTYDNVSEIKDMYKGMKMMPFEINYSANSVCKGKEIMIVSNSVKTCIN